MDEVEKCPSTQNRGFNVHIIDPFGETVTTSYKRFDLWAQPDPTITYEVCVAL